MRLPWLAIADSRPWAALPLATALGLLHALAFVTPGGWGLAWASQAGLLALWLRAGVATGPAVEMGLAYGLALDAGTTTWLLGAMARHPQAPVWVKLGGTVFAWLYDAMPWVLAAAAQAVFHHWGWRWRLLVFAPSGALAGWWLNSWLFGGLPWVAPAYAHLDTVLAGYFPVGGYLLVSLVAFWLAAATVLACHAQPRWWLGVAAVGLLGWSLQQVQWTHAVAAPVKVGIVQTRAALDFDPPKDAVQSLLAMNLRISKALVKRHQAQVIVWPEAALQGSPKAWSEALSKGLLPEFADTDFVLGMLATEVEPNASGAAATRRYNIALAGGPQSSGVHTKHHLLPFGEYWPQSGPVAWFADSQQRSRITPGPERQAPLRVRGQPVAASICYEDAYAAAFALVDQPPAWLVNLSDDAWFDGDMPYQHLVMSRARAMELGRYMVRAANVGPSAIISPDGRIQAQTRWGEVAMLSGTVTPLQGMTPFARWGHAWLLLWCAGVVFMMGRRLWLGRLSMPSHSFG